MTALFAKPPQPKPLPPVPNRSASEIQEEAARQRSRFYGTQGGRAMTMLTGGSGVGDTNSAVTRLLGGTS
jgi:hypothetical protein